MGTLYKGRGTGLDRIAYIDFINYVFGFNGANEDFLKLLPKLYKEEYDPCHNSFVVTEDGEFRAAVGVFPRTVSVMGETLVSHGIGNVAVHGRCRSKGYMKDCMHLALNDMIAAGADFSDLGGQRQRYNYFSYEACSPARHFSISANNLRHCFAGVPYHPVTFRRLEASDTELLDRAWELHEKKPFHVVRPREQFFDIVCSGYSGITAILDGDRFCGYFVSELSELTLADPADFDNVIRTYVAECGTANVTFPEWETAFCRRAWEICEGTSWENTVMISVFHFEKVVRAMLRFKASYSSLCDGSAVYRVNGIAGTETFEVTVKNNEVTVCASDREPTLTLEHRAAMSYFFGEFSPDRGRIAGDSAWFPLPIYLYGADHV